MRGAVAIGYLQYVTLDVLVVLTSEAKHRPNYTPLREFFDNMHEFVKEQYKTLV